MRLTLRTLLAYLDDILEPEDRASLQEKIEESEFAKTLAQRAGDVVDRPGLGAPRTLSRGMARDPNSVAEYLDNTMAPEQIQEFEKICLESDIHLAEVAASHHILTMVLGEPAPVDPASRERMYRLNERTVVRTDTEEEAVSSARDNTAEAKAVREAVSATATTGSRDKTASRSGEHDRQRSDDPSDQRPTPARETSGMPDYLRDERRPRSWSVLWTFLLGLLVAGGLIMAFDSDFRNALTRNDAPDKSKTGQPGGELDAGPGSATVAAPAGRDVAAGAPLDAALGGDATGQPAAIPALPPIDTGPPPQSTDTTPSPAIPADSTLAADSTLPADSTAGTTDALPPADAAAPPADTTRPTDSPLDLPPGTDTTEPADAGTPPIDTGTPPADTGTPPADTGTPPADAGTPPTDTGTTPADAATTPDQIASADSAGGTPPGLDAGPITPVDEPAEAGTDTPPEQSQVVGRLLSQEHVLLATQTTGEQLQRLPPRAVLSVGDKLLVLPTFRPMISVAATTLELDGETMIELTGVDQQGTPEIRVHYGRVLVRSLSMPDARIRLQMGDHEGVARFTDADSSFAVEVRSYRRPGTDPEKIPSLHAVDFFAASGRIQWSSDGTNETVSAPLRRVLSRHPKDDLSAGGALPAWISAPQVSQLDQRAVPWIEQGVRTGRSVKLSLSELAEHRRAEIQRLSYRCCAQIGYFDPLILALNDPDMRPRWDLYVSELRDAVARDPELAMQLRGSLERLRGDSGFDLYRMLWGYNRTGLTQGGEARQLVKHLDHDDLDYRVLSFWNLQELTGKMLTYRPEYSKLKRKQSVERWRKLAEKDEIVPLGPEEEDGDR